MSDLLILLPRQDDDPLIWAVRAGEAGVRWGVIGESSPPSARRVIAIAPGSEITLHAVTLPPGSESQARAAAPFAVEDEIALDVEAVHVALGPKPAGDALRQVAVVARERMDAWSEALAAAGLSPTQMTPDFLALPPAEGEAALVDAGDRILVRLPDGAAVSGFAVEPDLAALVIPRSLAEQEVEQVAAWADDLASLGLAGRGEAVRRAPRLTDEELLTRLMDGVAGGAPINLLQGAYRPRRRGGEDGFALERWRLAAGLAAAAVVAAFVGLAVEAWAYRDGARELRARTQLAYARAFPDEGRVANPANRARARVTSGGAGGVFLELAAVVFESARPLDRVQVETLRFDAAENALAFTVIYDAYADVEALKEAAAARGVTLEEGASRRRGARTSGDFVVRPS